ncbi:hypothetical protein CYMTET_31371 [Cymbomonas tetramitiformis]|uniref:mitogen-activated protein kinase kinase n=1 Tax=Cymbomonas tetramitiformis TaxID=36881 RepID=A0AAE0FH82_9CHLO|nr:hypothetical protein CYMTET_31371 [Cymbomonas tetramitiformis]
MLRVLEAVAHLHANSILHCDIKPENILVDDNGRALLTDFDISVDRGAQATIATSCVAGTLGLLPAPLHTASAC